MTLAPRAIPIHITLSVVNTSCIEHHNQQGVTSNRGALGSECAPVGGLGYRHVSIMDNHSDWNVIQLEARARARNLKCIQPGLDQLSGEMLNPGT